MNAVLWKSGLDTAGHGQSGQWAVGSWQLASLQCRWAAGQQAVHYLVSPPPANCEARGSGEGNGLTYLPYSGRVETKFPSSYLGSH